MENLIITLKTKIDINELLSYFHCVQNEYAEFKWVKEKNLDSTLPYWKDDTNASGIYGWAIDSNLEQLSDPCPPLNISTKPKVNYRNTSLAFGIVSELQQLFPFGYRWAISVLQPNGHVSMHTDDAKNITVWIPIINPKESLFMIEYQDKFTNYHLPADGSIYVVDTQYPHYTKNESTTERVILSFRCNKDNLTDLISK